jgi:hypothetical protein
LTSSVIRFDARAAVDEARGSIGDIEVSSDAPGSKPGTQLVRLETGFPPILLQNEKGGPGIPRTALRMVSGR